jgi:hypothetical protein
MSVKVLTGLCSLINRSIDQSGFLSIIVPGAYQLTLGVFFPIQGSKILVSRSSAAP